MVVRTGIRAVNLVVIKSSTSLVYSLNISVCSTLFSPSSPKAPIIIQWILKDIKEQDVHIAPNLNAC